VVDCTGARPVLRRIGAIEPGAISAALDAAGIQHDIGGA
jgi:hypothetical protein